MSVLLPAPSGDVALMDAATDTTLSYRELDRRVASMRKAFGERKQLVFVLCRNDVLTTVTYLAALEGGHAVALLDAGQNAQQSVAILTRYRPDWLAGPVGTSERLAAAGLDVASVQTVGDGELVHLGGGHEVPLHPDLALMLSTSGTTGSSKFVRLSAGNVRSNASAITRYLGLTASERPITSLPLHYTFGLSVLNSHIIAGAGIVLSQDSVIRREFWHAAEEHGCTSLAGVPYTYQMLERVGFRDMDLPDLVTMQQAGGALDQHLTTVYADHMRRRGGRLFVMYGQTEATARMAYVPPGRLDEKMGSAGMAIPGGHFRIDTSAAPAPGGSAGEVVYRGPNVMLGYASSRADLARGDEQHGELRTGDIGYLDDEGFLFLVGRSKRIAKVFGLRVNLDEVELLLRERGPAAVVSGDDAIWAFCAFGTDESVEGTGRELARRLRLHPGTLHLRRVDSIPTSSSGKVDYEQVMTWTQS